MRPGRGTVSWDRGGAGAGTGKGHVLATVNRLALKLFKNLNYPDNI